MSRDAFKQAERDLDVALERISLLNLVAFFQWELEFIARTGRAPPELGVSPRRSLTKSGLIKCTARGTSRSSFKLTPLAKQILKEI